jgi:hypothetical protein
MTATQDEDEEFVRLDARSIHFWRNEDRTRKFCVALKQASTTNLNRYDSQAWTFLTYVLANIHGSSTEMTVLRCLLGPEVLHEDHSRLRLDKCLVIENHSGTEMVQILTPMQVLQRRNQEVPFGNVNDMLINIEIAENLLRDAINRVETYPDRLLTTLEQAFLSCFPIVALYSIVVDYIVWP